MIGCEDENPFRIKLMQPNWRPGVNPGVDQQLYGDQISTALVHPHLQGGKQCNLEDRKCVSRNQINFIGRHLPAPKDIQCSIDQSKCGNDGCLCVKKGNCRCGNNTGLYNSPMHY